MLALFFSEINKLHRQQLTHSTSNSLYNVNTMFFNMAFSPYKQTHVQLSI